jgi:Dolichyl-phosphate-mannose-protein mannosyltransferase
MSDSIFKNAVKVEPEVLNRNTFCVLVSGLVLLSSCSLLLTTRWGIGLGGDSLVYIGVARNLLNGQGVVYFSNFGELAPVTHYPPLYPLVIAGFGLIGLDPLVAARWISVIFFAGNAVLISFIVYSCTLSYGASLLSSFFALTAFPMVQIHSMAWTEPVGMFFGFLGLLFFVRYVLGSKRFVFHFCSLSVGISCLTRYAGLAFVIAVIIRLWFFDNREWGKRFVDILSFCALSSVPLAVWVVRNAAVAGTGFNRTLGYYPPSTKDLMTAVDSLGLWFLPMGTPRAVIWIISLTLVVAAIGLGRSVMRKETPKPLMAALLTIFLLSYGCFLVIARIFFDPAINFDTRTLSPAYLAAMVLVVWLMTDWYKKIKSKENSWLLRMLNCSIITVSIMQMTASIAWMSYSYAEGVGYAGKVWREPRLVPFLYSAEPTTPLFSNAPDVIYLLTGKLTDMIPAKFNPDTLAANKEYVVQLASMKRQLMEKDGVLLYVTVERRLPYLPSEQELQNELSLRLIERVRVGNVYQIN